MFGFTIIAILLMAQIIAYRNERKLADTLGVMCCGFILVLYLLALFRVLSWIDYISIPVLIIGLFWILKNGLAKKFIVDFFTIQNVCILITVILLVLSQKDRIALWWDDINFWATDVKALWMRDGFAGKYGNVAPEFGDYPPAIQLFKWFFLHIGGAAGTSYQEGLAFSGYLVLNFVLLLPLISKLDRIVTVKESILAEEDENVGVKLAKNKKYYVSDKHLISKYKVRVAGNNREIVGERINPVGVVALVLANICACVCLILLPTVANIVCFEGTCVDVTMGIVYGMLLLATIDKDREHAVFYFVRLALYGCVLVLTKTVGAEWGAYAIVFMIVMLIYDRKGERYNQASLFETNVRYGIFSVLSWGVTLGSWMVFCLFNRRVANLTSTGVKMATSGNVSLGYYASEKVPVFLQGLALYPMHTDKTWGIDLSVVAIAVVFIVAIILMCKKNIITKSFKKILMIYSLATFVVAYGIILIGHLTIFATETQYSTGQVMAISISRYGAPWVLGTMILLIGIYIGSLDRVDETRPVADSYVKDQMIAGNFKRIRVTYIVIAVLIVITSDWNACYKGLVSYRNTLEQDMSGRQTIIDDKERQFVKMVADNHELWGKRVLYLKDASDVRWVHNAYINYEVSPVAVVYGAISSEASEEDLNNLISSSHAKYLYVEDIEGVDERLGFVQDWEHAGEQGKVKLFRIVDGGRIEPYRETIER